MLHKWGLFAVGIAGAAAVLACFLVGRDPAPAARTGPRWRKRLLGAGLVALSILGFVVFRQVQDKLAPPAPKPEPEPSPEPAEPDPLADRMKDAIRALEAALAAWPDDADAVRALLAETDGAIESERDEPPPGWVPRDPLFFEMWLGRRNTMRVTASPTPEEVERKRLGRRVEELQRLMADRLYRMTGEIADTFEWQTITRAWRRADPWSHNDELLGYGGSTPERHRADWELWLASKAIAELERKGLFLKAEADLLGGEACRLSESIYKCSPDDIWITCYRPVYVDPAQISTERLRQRVALLRQLKADRKVTGAVLEKMAASIRQDLDTSSGKGKGGHALGYTPPAQPSEEEKLRTEVTLLLKSLEELSKGDAGGRGEAAP